MPEFDTCKDCNRPESDYTLAVNRGRCPDCFSEYGQYFRRDAEVAFVNHILILRAGTEKDQARADIWSNQYWHDLKAKEGNPFTICGHSCLRNSEVGLAGLAGDDSDPVAVPHPDCDVHGYAVQYNHPELARLARTTA